VKEWSHQFRVNATIGDIYEYGLSPQRWFSFYPAYGGVDTVDDDWPSEGTSIVVWYKLAGPARMRIRQTVTAHDPERLLQMEESALGGLWIDHPSLAFESMPDGSVNVTLKVRPTTRFALAKPLIWLVSLPFGQITPKAMSAFASMVEEAAAQKR